MLTLFGDAGEAPGLGRLRSAMDASDGCFPLWLAIGADALAADESDASLLLSLHMCMTTVSFHL